MSKWQKQSKTMRILGRGRIKTVLVTGGAGYIGSHTCKELASQGYLPITLDNLQTGFRKNVKWGPFVEGDIRDSQLVTQLIRSHKIETVILLLLVLM